MTRRLAHIARGLVIACAGFALAACSTTQVGSNSHTGGGDGHLHIFATTGYLGDAAAVIAPEAEITVMVKPGGDPHTYQPTTADIEAMQSADLVLWNGLHLEALMTEQLEGLGDRGLEVGATVSEDLLLGWPETDNKGNPLHDPHIWNSPDIWSGVVDVIAQRISELDPDNAETYAKNAADYIKKIEEIDQTASEKIANIPDSNRILVTGHDAFNYLGARYNLKVYATDFVTSEAELSPTQLEELATTIANGKVPTIFVDNLKNPQAVESLREAVAAKGWDVQISDQELYADSLGEKAPVDTYLGVFEHNLNAIIDGLGDK